MMGYILSGFSCFNLIYYVLLVSFTDYEWKSQLYWPVSAVVFAIFAILLMTDSKRFKKRGEGLPLKVRVPIVVTLGSYLMLILAFTVVDLLMGFDTLPADQDYLILVETTGQVDKLTDSDCAMLDTALNYTDNLDSKECKMVLAGYNLEDEDAEHTTEIQSLMQLYLEDKGFEKDRMIIHKAADSLRKNIRYNYAYVLVDWYEKGHEQEEKPEVTILANQLSVLRYRLMIHNSGLNVHVMTYKENLLCWPARIMEEVVDTVYCHLTNQFKYQ